MPHACPESGARNKSWRKEQFPEKNSVIELIRKNQDEGNNKTSSFSKTLHATPNPPLEPEFFILIHNPMTPGTAGVLSSQNIKDAIFELV